MLEVGGPSEKRFRIVVFMTAPQEGLDRVRHLGGRSQTEGASAAKPTPQSLHVASSPGKTPGKSYCTKAQMPENGAHSNMSWARGDQRACRRRRPEGETGMEDVAVCRVEGTNQGMREKAEVSTLVL